MTKPKVVLDTNIFLSAIIFGGIPRKILELGIDDQITIYTSPGILLETAQKLKDKFQWSREEIVYTIQATRDISKIIIPDISLQVVTADPEDNKIVELAVAAGVEWMITGDNHLLKLQEYQHILIRTPRDFWEYYSLKKDK